MSVQLHHADCREVMRAMPDNTVDALVSDPPYEIGFMGAGWDSGGIAFDRTVWTEAYRVLKPGGFVLAFGATRTWHWLACALELSGFESRGSIAWLNGQGMQHGLDVSKAMDADAGAEREVVGKHPNPAGNGSAGTVALGGAWQDSPDITAPATEEAREWAGWGTQLAPKHEPIAMFRKPLDGTYVENIRAHGVGGLNIDGCRLEGGKRVPSSVSDKSRASWPTIPNPSLDSPGKDPTVGRWPPNAVLDEAVQAQLDAMVGRGPRPGGRSSSTTPRRAMEGGELAGNSPGHGWAQGPSAFFYCPKAPTGERDRGCEHLRWVRDGSVWRLCEAGEKPDTVGNIWPTVKPLELMRWLVRLVTPRGGLVLDPFFGSGTTGVAAVCEGMRFVGADTSPVAHMIATARIRWAQGLGPEPEQLTAGLGGQASLF